MSVLKDASERLNNQDRGFLPVPALVVITYGVLCNLVHYSWICCLTIPHIYDFWSEPQCMGLSLLELFTTVNILLTIYLLVSVWSFTSEKSSRSIRALSHWVSYIFAFVLVIMLQVYIHKTGDNFKLPDEIMSLKEREYHELPRRGLEDVILPRSGMCQGFKKPFEERCIIVINRPGYFIVNRRNHGRVDAVMDKIRSHLSSRVEQLGRESDGVSNLILLIRADRDTRFKYIHEVMQICQEKDVRIYRIEFNCNGDLDLIAPEAARELKHYYELPEGKLNAYLPRNMDVIKSSSSDEMSRRIKVEVFSDKSVEEGFYMVVLNQRFEGPEMMKGFCRMMEDLRKRKPDLKATIVAHEDVEYGQIIKVFSECLRTEVYEVLFESAPSAE